MKANVRSLVTLVLLMTLPAIAAADVLDDHFEGSALSGDWAVALGGTTATDWTYSVSGSKLHITDIADSSLNSGWAAVTLTYDLGEYLDEFSCNMLFDWDSAGTNAVRQRLALGLYADGSRVAEIAYRDVWADNSAALWVVVEGEDTFAQDPGVLALSGSAGQMELSRDGADLVHAEWNGTELFSGSNSTQANEVRITISTYGTSGTYFGSFDIDRVAATPEPATVALLGVGMAFVLRPRRRRR